MNSKLKGMGIALITPFKKDETIDYKALKKLLEYQIKNKTDYLVILGTTAEAATLSNQEKKDLIVFVKESVNGRIPLVIGVGGNNTRQVKEDLETMDFEGFSAILSVCPYYNKPSQEGIYLHYSEIAKVSPLPIILYNVPGRTGVNMTAETTLRLAKENKKIIAIKEASGNLPQINEIIKNKPDSFNVISGDDGMTFPMITMGSIGVISVIGNAFPLEFSRMIRLIREGDYENALKIHYLFTELFELLFVDGNPAGVKSMLHDMGYIENTLRLPLVATRVSTSQKIRDVLKKLNIKY